MTAAKQHERQQKPIKKRATSMQHSTCAARICLISHASLNELKNVIRPQASQAAPPCPERWGMEHSMSIEEQHAACEDIHAGPPLYSHNPRLANNTRIEKPNKRSDRWRSTFVRHKPVPVCLQSARPALKQCAANPLHHIQTACHHAAATVPQSRRQSSSSTRHKQPPQSLPSP